MPAGTRSGSRLSARSAQPSVPAPAAQVPAATPALRNPSGTCIRPILSQAPPNGLSFGRMAEAPALTVRFWGVRGSIACPSPAYMGFGGNTSCVEVRVGERILILDAGTGVRALGKLLRREGAREADILFSHTHWDHVNGFPFFAPAFEPDHAFRVFAGHLSDAGGIREAIAGHMHEPMFPVPLDVMKARLAFTDFRAGETLDLGPGVRARTAPLNHPNGATAYRIEHAGRSVCYVTDTEHVPGRPDENVLGAHRRGRPRHLRLDLHRRRASRRRWAGATPPGRRACASSAARERGASWSSTTTRTTTTT